VIAYLLLLTVANQYFIVLIIYLLTSNVQVGGCSGVTTLGQFWSMNRLPFGLNRLPCPQIG